MKNNGIVNTGKGTVVATGATIGTPTGDDNDPNTNNGVINTAGGTVIVTGATIDSGNNRNSQQR